MNTQDLDKFNWETEHVTAKNQMIHTFENGVTVIFNRNFGLVIVDKNGEPINSFEASEMLVDEWLRFLINTAKQAESC